MLPVSLVRIAHGTVICAVLAVSLAAICTYNERVVLHSTRVAQHRRLLDSDVCADPSLRVATHDVNGCDSANLIVKGFSPQMHALVDLLESLSPCGRQAGRCEELATILWASAHRIVFFVVGLCFLGSWLFLKNTKSTQAPLLDSRWTMVKIHLCPFTAKRQIRLLE